MRPASPRTSTWSQSLPDSGNPVSLSSPNVANLDGQPCGRRRRRAPGRSTPTTSAAAPAWPAGPTTRARRSTPRRRSLPSRPAAPTRSSSGAATPATPRSAATRPSPTPGATSGSSRRPTRAPTRCPIRAWPPPSTVGNYAGGYGVEAGSLGQNTYALGAGNGAMLGGFPWFQADDVRVSTAAVADLYADGDNELISGGDSSAGVAYGQTYSNGGHIRILSSAGNAGTRRPFRWPHLPVQHHAEHRPLVARRRPVPLRRSGRHRRRGRELLLGGVGLEQGLRHQHRAAAWPGAISSTASPPTHPPSPT